MVLCDPVRGTNFGTPVPNVYFFLNFLKRRSITYKISRVVKFVLPVPGNCDDLQPLEFIE